MTATGSAERNMYFRNDKHIVWCFVTSHWIG
jgi:hypothetical protein